MSIKNGPIGKTFDFFGLDLVVDSIMLDDNCFDYRRDVLINAHRKNYVDELYAHYKSANPFGIKRVIFNGPATIVFWTDNTKTVVKCAEEEVYNQRTAIMWAIMKKTYGNSSRVNKAFDKLIEDAESTNDENFADTEKLIKDTTKNLLNSIFGANANRK